MPNNSRDIVRQEIQIPPAKPAGPNTPFNHPKMRGIGLWVFISAALIFIVFWAYLTINPPYRMSSTLKLGPLKLENNVEWKQNSK